MIKIKHYEIPLDMVESNLSDRLPREISDSLVFERNGKKFVRWIINPEDTKFSLELKNFLIDRGLPVEEHTFFEAYQTASRSYVVENPITGATFSLKVSTNQAGGIWKDKPQRVKDSSETRLAADYLQMRNKVVPFEHIKLLDEPGAFGIKEIDQGMMIRTLPELQEGKFNYLPGFSAMHSSMGRQIANLNGFSDPAEFWNKYYNKVLARGLAELVAKTGVTLDSPHSQNFIIELDQSFRPTGKILFKDLGDLYLDGKLVVPFGGEELYRSFPGQNKMYGAVAARAGIMHGNYFPDWLSAEEYSQWGADFSKEFDRELAKQVGIAPEKLGGAFLQNEKVFGKKISTNLPEWDAHIAKFAVPKVPAKNLGVSPVEASVNCQSAFQLIDPI